MDAQRGFSTNEFEQRCRNAQAAMAAKDIDALLLSTEADIRYFTGFMTQFWQSPTRPWHSAYRTPVAHHLGSHRD